MSSSISIEQALANHANSSNPMHAVLETKVPVLLSSLHNESALVTDRGDNSDTNETFHDAETISDKAHVPMLPSPLSPRWVRVSSPYSNLDMTQPDLNMNPRARQL